MTVNTDWDRHATPTDPGAIAYGDLVKLLRNPHKEEKGLDRYRRSEAANAIEALRERVTEMLPYEKACLAVTDWCTEHDRSDITGSVELIGAIEAAETRVVELAAACRIVLAELPEDDEGIEIGNLQRLLCACRAALAATPAEALERARAKDAFIDLSKILLARGHLGLVPPTSGSGRKTIADWRKALAKLDALGKEEE